MSDAVNDGISLAIIVRNPSKISAIVENLSQWSSALQKLDRPSQLIVVDDGNPPEIAEAIAKSGVTVIRHDSAKGFGACVRAALEIATQPIFGYVGSDYPYQPSDLKKLLAEYGKKNDDYKMAVDLVSGCRTGIATPQPWKTLGVLKRFFYRWALGNPLPPYPGWYGVGEHWRNWRTSVVYGNPFHDVNCAFKLFRKSRLETIPIQCDDDAVHIELVAKMTFLTTLMAEVNLAPQSAEIPATDRFDLKRIKKKPAFRKPIEPQPIAVAVS